jgi:nucleotide-binding universal stress UspA family protein
MKYKLSKGVIIMYHKMLVLLDGSKLAQVVFTYAQELAGRMNLCLELLQVVDPRDADQLPIRQAYIEHMSKILEEKANQVRTKTGINTRCETVKGTVAVGYPAEEILKYVDANKVDLLMLSTHGKSGIKNWNIGSVAGQVIHAARIPLWIVPSELDQTIIQDMIPNRTIVVPLNGEKVPEDVIPYAVSIAKQRGAESEISLIFVDKESETVRNRSELQELNERRDAINKYLEGVAQKIIDSGISARWEILTGDPASEIVEYMRDKPPQLIAMAAPRSGLSKMVFGSVAENLLQLLKKTPLLLIPR